MRAHRTQFTIRSLMYLVAVVAGLLALVLLWRDLLPVVIAVIMPTACLSGLLGEMPQERREWRHWISAARLGLIVLGAGWLWARSVISYFQRQEGYVAIGGASRGTHFEFWGLTLPSTATGICLVVYVSILVLACVPRRRRALLWFVVAYAASLAVAWVFLFADLGFEAFD